MPRLYNRKCKLTITGVDGTSRIIRDLRMSFEITKSIRSYPNLARINIYNANDDTLSLLQTKYTEITLDAGYEAGLSLLFKGQVRNAIDTHKDVNRIMTVYAGDAERDWQNAIFNRTLSANVNIETVLKEIGATFPNTTLGDTSLINIPADKLRGQTLSGSSKDILDVLAEDYGFDWSIQDNELIFLPNESILLPNESVLITSSTGMIGSPTVTEIGVDVTTLLNSKLQPNKSFTVQSSSNELTINNLFFREVRRTKATGQYKIQEVVHKGDTHDNDWISTSKGIIYNAVG